MIDSKKDLKIYLEADKKALRRDRKRPAFFDLVWKFEISLRKYEYYHNCKRGIVWRLVESYYRIRYSILSILCGFEIPLNCFDEGLSIAHRGNIIVNRAAHIGKNCRLHIGVNIGTAPGCSDACPIIGDDVYIGPGAKLYGRITVASGIMIGANAVVTKSFTEENICIAGVPARKIGDRGRFEIENLNSVLYGKAVDFRI